jgi:hypothetical protein
VTKLVDYTSFQLSRVYAQGWNAGKRLTADARLDAKAMDELNPYKAEPQRARWAEGFFKASE